MNITVSQQGSTEVAVITGDITHSVAGDLQEKLLAVLCSTDFLVLDFAGIGILTSAGLRMLLILYREAKVNGKKLVLVAIPESVKDVMSVTGFLEQFVVLNSVNEAIEQVSKSILL
ncbi:MAG: STAS domain-containing protein [Chlorobiaceae bacterium]